MKQDYGRTSSVTQMLQDLNWKPLKDRRRDIRLALLLKIIKGNIAVETEGILIKGDHRTRNKYRHLKFSSVQYQNSFFVKTIPDFNTTTKASFEADILAPLAGSRAATP